MKTLADLSSCNYNPTFEVKQQKTETEPTVGKYENPLPKNFALKSQKLDNS
jgi:hypothetical protein